ncbi:MAG: flagellar M-ring protein FliF, partial [Treponema sp.]|nr:flagellar M-ring protein FliF [Treponema sp.]
LKASILNHLQGLAKEKRIGDLVVNVEMDMSEKSMESTVYTPIQRKADNPNTPYDDSDYVDTLPVSQQTVTKEWQGTGYNPEGPAGVEGQTPPVYSDMSNVVGKSVETGVTQNNVINTTHTVETVAPQTGRTSVSLNVDGKWTLLRDPKTHDYIVDDGENGTGGLKRKYTPVSPEELAEYKRLVEGAINYNQLRGDSVQVTNIQVDRTEEFEEFDNAYFKAQQTKRTVLLSLVAVAVVLVGFILFRIISKEMERRRRAREEELLRQQQLAREQALWEAKDEAQTVTMSVEESRRAELQENAINMAKEHPEDVAMLIRTWLMEE